ncbi:MAG: S-layer homology domain-containing protein [Oscillospiraceae bacterium]|nr:S-layer homology domain-containing protein [Oscillospiraceae bacterium]
MAILKLLRKTLLAALVLLALSASACAFSDVPQSYWARPYVDAAAETGLLKGYRDGTFRPSEKVTNAEFLTICVRAVLGEPAETEGAWWQRYLNAAREAEWEIPYGEDKMNDPASRYDMARVLQAASPMRTLFWETYKPCAPIERKRYPDLPYDDELEHYLQTKAVQWASDTGLLTGYKNGTFGGEKTLSRAEASAVLTRLLCHVRLAKERANIITADGTTVIYFCVDDEKNTHIRSENMLTGAKISEAVAVQDLPADPETAELWRKDPQIYARTMQFGNGKYFWGEFGMFEYAADGSFKRLTDRAVIDYGYDAADGSIVAITHEKGKRCFFSGDGVTWESGNEVVRIFPDGSETLLLSEEAGAGGWSTAGALVPGGVMLTLNLTKVELASAGAVEVTAEEVWGMGDWHRYRFRVENGALTLLQMGAGNGYSY